MTDIQTNGPTNQQTEMKVHKEVTISKNLYIFVMI